MITEPRVHRRPLTSVCRLLSAFLLMGILCMPLTSQAASGPAELLNAGRVDEALRLLIPQATATNAAAFNYLCRAYFELGDWDNAVKNCERAVRLDSRNAEFQLWLGRSYGEKANVAGPLSAYSLARKSVAAFSAAHALDRQSVAIARDLAEFYASAPSIVGGGSDKALALAAEIAPNYPADAAWVRAMVASNAGNHEQAEREYNQSITLSHESAANYLEFARYLRGRKRWDDFQKAIQHAIASRRIQPTDRYDAAEMLLKVNRDLPLAAQQMRAYIQGAHTEEAAPLFRAHFLLGEILRKSGDSTQAAAEYRAALALASTFRPAVEALGHLGKQ